jgi:flagellar biosynthesis chaperone FliJ
MSLHPLDSRITSCCAEIIEALCTQNRDLKRELEEAYNQFELIKYQLEKAQTERDKLCEQLNCCRLNGFDPNEGGY